jgi:SAM-dependent methyltransferase
LTTTATLDALKAKQQQTWASGDYGKIAWITVPVAETLCVTIDVRPGARVLDVATGTGHAALSAARRFCKVTGVDYVPALIDTARRRAAAEGLAVDFMEADAESLPFADGSFDYVLSALGVMFTADHARAAAELVRVCRPGGRIGLANWTPAGFIGAMLRIVSQHVPPPPEAQPPTRWGDEETVRGLLGDAVAEVTAGTYTTAQRYPTPGYFADFFIAHYGPTHKAAQRLTDEQRRAFRDDLVALADKWNQATDGTFAGDWEYLLVTVTKR